VALWFTKKDRSRSQVAVQCTGLASREAAAGKKRYWEERFAALDRVIRRA
jgi:hypothetical protein